jgi:hypothetical protein
MSAVVTLRSRRATSRSSVSTSQAGSTIAASRVSGQ